MPAPRTDIDRDAVAARVALQGVRNAARDLDLPTSTVMDIARAAGVVSPAKPMRLVPAEQPKIAVRTVNTSAHLSAQPAHAQIVDVIASYGAASRLAVAQYGARVLPYAADIALESPETALAMAGDVSSVIKGQQGARVPGFERESERTSVQVNILNQSGPQPMELPTSNTPPLHELAQGVAGESDAYDERG